MQMKATNLRKIQFLFALWLTGLLVFVASEKSLTIYAQAFEARVTSVSGRAAISGNGRSNARLARGTVLAPGDEVNTTGGGRVVIDLSDGSQVVVLSGSRVVIGNYRNAASLRELLQITLGRIRVKINNFKGKPNPYRIKSPTASIAVRGTEFDVIVEPTGETRVIVLEGSVEVASLRDPTNPLIAEPKRGVVVRPDSTIDFFVSDLMTKEMGDRDERTGAANGANNADAENSSSRTASNIYERSIESVLESGETSVPSRYTAFPDPYLDSLENPAYADAFTRAEGRFYSLPSLGGVSNSTDAIRDRLGLRKPHLLDYSLVPEAAVFVPVKRFRAVVGGSAAYVRNSSQSLTVNENSTLTSPPFPVDTDGVRVQNGAATNNFFNGSLIFVRRFGSRDKTSIGFSVERLTSRGTLNEKTTQTDEDGLTLNEQSASRSSVNRTRFTFGVKHDFGNAKFGAFFRRSLIAGSDVDRFRLLDGATQPNNGIRAKGSSTEIGFRLRGTFSRRLFYGSEGMLLFGRSRVNIQRSTIVDSTENATITRATLGFGIGYVLRPRTIFSFDIAGGLIRSKEPRTENLTGNLLESERQRARFLSLHAAVQTDVWRNLFVSASLLSITQSRTTDTALFPDRFGRLLNSEGVFVPNERTKDFFTDYYSNYGIGWRFKPNFIVHYVLTTDYGKTAPRHTFLLRYTFDFQRK